jgi:hypothetical protein
MFLPLDLKVDVLMNGINMADYDDWVIESADSFSEATLISDSGDVDTKIMKAFVKQHAAQHHNTAFNFDPQIDVPNCPRDVPGPSASASPSTPGGAGPSTPLRIDVPLPLT